MEASGVSKSDLRNRFRKDRELTYIPGSWLHILESAEFSGKRRIASYISYGYEPETRDLNSAIIKRGIELVLPATQKDNSLLWYLWDGNETSLKKRGKVLEPHLGTPVDSSTIDLFIVPTLHVNRSGYRLGQGGGSYDRALAGSTAWKIGLIYSHEITAEEIPVEPHDQKLDAAATPEMIVRFSR